MRKAWKDPRPTLAAYGAPLVVAPKRDMALEEALVRALVAGRRDPTLVLSVPVVLLDNSRTLDSQKLFRAARRHGVASELGMMLELTARVGRRRAFARLARLLPKRTGRPAYYPRLLGGRRGRALADLNTPPVVARWGFRMNETEDDLRAFVEKHRVRRAKAWRREGRGAVAVERLRGRASLRMSTDEIMALTRQG